VWGERGLVLEGGETKKGGGKKYKKKMVA